MNPIRRVLEALGRGLTRASMIGLSKRHTFYRYQMYVALEKIGGKLPMKTGAVLSISHSAHLCKILGIVPSEVTEASYPAVSIFDLPFADNTFDFVLSDQVLEHIKGPPERAFSESLRVAKPGGVIIHTTCMCVAIHGEDDYWRFTPNGLSLLFGSGAAVIESSGWGHPLVPFFNFLGLDRLPVPNAQWHPFHICATWNWPSYPYSTWVVARKNQAR